MTDDAEDMQAAEGCEPDKEGGFMASAEEPRVSDIQPKCGFSSAARFDR